jgi:hypothetical protein
MHLISEFRGILILVMSGKCSCFVRLFGTIFSLFLLGGVYLRWKNLQANVLPFYLFIITSNRLKMALGWRCNFIVALRSLSYNKLGPRPEEETRFFLWLLLQNGLWTADCLRNRRWITTITAACVAKLSKMPIISSFRALFWRSGV